MSINRIVCSVLVIALLLSVSGPMLAAQNQLRTEKVKPGDLKGFLKDPKGRPFPQVELTVVNDKGDVVQKAVTNSNGEYVFKNLPEGNYVLKVAGKEAFKLQVTPAAGITSIQARLPGTVRDEETGLIVPDSLSTLEWTLVIIGGVGVAVAVPAVIHHNQDDSDRKKKPVSP